MALEKQHVSVPFQAGHNSQRDRKLLPNGVLSRAENVRFDEEMRLVKRFGYTGVTLQDAAGNPLDADVFRVFQRGSERCMIGSGRLYSQLDADDSFEDVGPAQEIGHVRSATVYRSGARNIHYIDSARGGGLICYVWVESEGIWEAGGSAVLVGTVWTMVVDEVTGTVVELYEAFSGDCYSTRVVACGNGFMLAFLQSVAGTPTLYCAYKAWALPLAAGWGLATSLGTLAGLVYDMDAYAQFAYFAYPTGGTTNVIRVTTLKAITHTVNVAVNSSQAVAVSAQQERVWVAMGDASGASYTTHSLATAAVTTAATALEASASTFAFSWGRGTSTQMRIAYVADSAFTVKDVTITPSVTAVHATYNLAPISRMETSTGRYFVVLQQVLWEVDTITSSTFLCELTSAGPIPVGVLARYSAPTLDLVAGLGMAGNILALTEGFAFARANLFQSYDRGSPLYTGGLVGLGGLERWVWTFRDRSSQLPVEYKNTVYFSGGIITQYDGQAVTELGFCWGPEIELTDSATSGGLTTGQSYGVVATYEWTDSAGNRHISQPSVQKNITPTGTSVDVEIATLNLTRKRNVEIHLYVTEGNGTIPKRITIDSVGIIANDPSAASITYNLGTPGDDGTDILYTVGGVLSNSLPVSAQHLVAHKNRLWAASSTRVWYSKLDVANEGVAFAEEFTLPLPDGEVTALAALDDATLFFQENRIFATYGDGPNDRGDGQFAEPVKIPSDIGTTNPNSVISYQQGVLFEGPRGPHVIPRGLGAPVWIGGRVRDFFDTTGKNYVTTAHLVPGQSQVRLGLSTGEVLCLDYRMGELGEWTTYTFDALAGVGVAGVWNGVYLVGDGFESNFLQETTSYDDDGEFVVSTIETGDIRLAGVQGYKRVWRTLLLGEYGGGCQVVMSVAYDGSASYSVASDAWVPSGSAGDQVEFAWHMRRQQVESVRIKLADAQTGEFGATAGLVWNGLTFEVGMQRGAQRIAPGNRSA